MAKNIRKNFVFFILAFLICLNILAGIVILDLNKVRFLEVNFFDVGQGDAIFIETPKRHQILIDGGPGSVILEKLAKEMPFWDRTIDLVILTHPEKDHLVGLLEVLKRYKVENILWTGVVRETEEFREWEKAIEEEKAKIFIAKGGQKIKLHRSDLCNLSGTEPCEFFLEILYPFEDLKGQKFENSNDTSIVAKLIFGKNSFLFTGDIQKLAEKKIIESKENLDSDILKIAHHGSKTSSSEGFIKEVSPALAVISVGRGNSYGHPHQEVLDVLRNYGIRILRTDLDGDIKIISDGNNYEISHF